MQEEIWKDIPNYEGYYQVSDLGNVRSLDRVVHCTDGNTHFRKRRTLRLFMRRGYQSCGLSINRTRRTYPIHQLVAMTFLNHTPNGSNSLVVDHINHIKTDNRLENLQLVTNRYNTTKDRKAGTSKYPGVSWGKRNKKWQAQVSINGKKTHLGYFTDEAEAALAYQKALENHLAALKNC